MADLVEPIGDGNEPLLDNEGQAKTDRVRTGTFFGTVTNLLNNAIGSGVLVFPYAYGQTGILLGMLLSTAFAGVLAFCYHIVGRSQFETGAVSYQALMRSVLGRRGEQLALLTQLLFLIGGCVGYLDIVSDQVLGTIGTDHPLAKRYIVIPIAAFCCCMPLMFIRNIQKLSPMSTFSLISVIYTTTVLLIRSGSQLQKHGIPESINGEPTSEQQVSTFRHSADIFRSIPIFAFAFMLHPSYCLVLDEMKDQRLATMDKAVSITLVACVCFYAVYGVFGYWFCANYNNFSTDTRTGDLNQFPPQDILNAFPSDWYDIVVARFGMAVSVISSYVALHFGARTCLQDLLLEKGQTFTQQQFVLEIIVYLVITGAIAIAVPGVGTVIDFSAGTTVVALQFCFPGALAVALANGETAGKQKAMGWFFIIFGIIIGACAVTVSGIDAAAGK